MYIHGRIYGLSGRELDRRINELLDFVDLKQYANKVVRYFSGGMRRRLEIARALLHEPEILFLDEPTLGLDPQTRNRVWDYIMRIKREKGLTILMTTHYMDEAEMLCDRIGIMDHGKVIAEGTADQLKSMIGSDVVIVRFQEGGSTCLEPGDGIISCREIMGGGVELIVKEATKILPRIFDEYERRGLNISEISYRRPSLNEVFLHLTGRELRDGLESNPRPIMRRR